MSQLLMTPSAIQMRNWRAANRERNRLNALRRDRAKRATASGKIENRRRAAIRMRLVNGRGLSDERSIRYYGAPTQVVVDHLMRSAAGRDLRDLHIDHIQPLAAFDQGDPEQCATVWNYQNLRLIPVVENRAKGYTCPGRLYQRNLLDTRDGTEKTLPRTGRHISISVH